MPRPHELVTKGRPALSTAEPATRVRYAAGEHTICRTLFARNTIGRLIGSSQIVSRGEPLPQFDLHCPLLSLPLAFGTRLESIPSAVRMKKLLLAAIAIIALIGAAKAQPASAYGQLVYPVPQAGQPSILHKMEAPDRRTPLPNDVFGSVYFWRSTPWWLVVDVSLARFRWNEV